MTDDVAPEEEGQDSVDASQIETHQNKPAVRDEDDAAYRARVQRRIGREVGKRRAAETERDSYAQRAYAAETRARELEQELSKAAVAAAREAERIAIAAGDVGAQFRAREAMIAAIARGKAAEHAPTPVRDSSRDTAALCKAGLGENGWVQTGKDARDLALADGTDAVFGPAVPAILAWLAVGLREQWNRILLGRTIAQAAGAGYAAMIQAGADGDAGIDLAIGKASDYVSTFRPDSFNGDRHAVADLLRAEIGTLMACRPPRPGSTSVSSRSP